MSPLPSRKINGINGLVPLTEMIMLTYASEATVASDSGPIAPTTVVNRIQGYEGSYGIRPVVIGNRALYVQSTGSIVHFTIQKAHSGIHGTWIFPAYVSGILSRTKRNLLAPVNEKPK